MRGKKVQPGNQQNQHKCSVGVGSASRSLRDTGAMSALVMEGWLWKKKASTAGSLFKSVTRRYCTLDAKATMECYDDQGGELLTRVKIASAKSSGKWLYISGYNEVKLKQCRLRFQGDFENDTADWADKVLQVVGTNAEQPGRSRGETDGFFFEAGEKRDSAISVQKQTDAFGRLTTEDDAEEDAGGVDSFLTGDNDEEQKDKDAGVKEEEQQVKDETREHPHSDSNSAVKTSGTDAGQESQAKVEATEASQANVTEDQGSVSNPEEAKPAEEGSGTQEEGASDPKPEPDDEAGKAAEVKESKTASSLWGKVAQSTNASPAAAEASAQGGTGAAKTAAGRWQIGAEKAVPKKKGPKKLYGADLLKHLALQSVHDMRVSKEAAEMERWKAKCELGDEMNPSKTEIFCIRCDERVTGTYVNLNGKTYHKDCFTCVFCECSVSGGAYEVNGMLYCEQHRMQVKPNCHRCKLDIEGKYIVGPSRSLYHADCFSCKGCSRKIRTYCEHENEIYCVSCYSASFASKCTACGENLKDRIRTLQGSEEAAGMKWHETCFKCSTCNKRLHQKVFFQEKKLFCEYCMKKSNLPSCKKCRMPIEGACVNALDASWHPKCFVCTECKDPLKGFISKEGKPYCKGCFDNKFSKMCDLCHKPIKGPFLNALGKTFHDTCFVCCNCNKKIEGAFMKSPDDLPCCSKDCLGEYYKNVILPKKKTAAGA